MLDLNAVDGAVRSALRTSTAPELADGHPDDDLFSALDSFAVVELLLETEARIEELVGRYVPLGNDTILDAEKSPLRKLSGWVQYVSMAISGG